MRTVTESWAAIDRWIAQHAPAGAQVQRPPATEEALAAAEHTLGLGLPPQLRESLLCHDGQEHGSLIFPDLRMLPLAEIIATRDEMTEVADDEVGRDGDDDWWWHAGWLPVARLDGDLEVVDCRPGPGHGRIGHRSRDDVAQFGPGWGYPSLAALLDRVATALTTGTPWDDLMAGVDGNGVLFWDTF